LLGFYLEKPVANATGFLLFGTWKIKLENSTATASILLYPRLNTLY
jgi:hypothetical protein